MLAKEMAIANNTSFVFSKELRKIYKIYFNKKEMELFKNICYDFNRNLHIINDMQTGLILANLLMPFTIHLKDARGEIPYGLAEPMILQSRHFLAISNVIEQINIVLTKIIPGLQILVNPLNNETMDNGKTGTRFEFLSLKDNKKLPLRCESAGILKLISILSVLIAVFNEPNSCVVIDELDSGVFEYLLGELLEIINENGKGQLFFTSHNLRALEVLPNKNLWFTTTNENNRFVRLKGVKRLSNSRDIYIRAVQLGGQDENLYRETDIYSIKKSFRKAGKLDV
jgi:AAA15 family ATPase/GTPase